MTNGEKFQQIFAVSQVDECDLNVYAWLPCHDAIEIPLEWWNTNYSEIPTGSTTKNDLGVDCVSRADAIKAMQDKAKKLKNEDTINGLCGAVAILFDMPSVTSQPRKGHWKLVQRGKAIDVCCSNCEAVRIKGYAYNYTIDELNKEDINECFGSAEMRFCPNCGSDNREVEE